MSKRQLVIMWIAIVLLVATWIYPPWIRISHPVGSPTSYSMEWSALFDPTENGMIAYWPLLLEDAIIVAFAAGLILSFRKSN